MKKLFILIFILLLSVFGLFSQATGDPAIDMQNHIIYADNSYSTDFVIHTLDFSSETGGERAFAIIDFESIAQGYSLYGDNGVTIYIREKGSSIDWTVISLSGVGKIVRVYELSDANGEFEVKVENGAPFLYNPGAPVECFGWIQFQITLKWVVQSEM